MKVKLDTVTKPGLKEADSTEFSFLGQIQHQDKELHSRLGVFQKEMAKRGVDFFYILDDATGDAWFKFAMQPNARKAGRPRQNRDAKHFSTIEVLILLTQYSDKAIYQMMGISESTFYRAKRRLKNSRLYQVIEQDENLTNVSYLQTQTDRYVSKSGKVYYASDFLA